MRITSIETCAVNAEMRNWVFVKVLTGEPGLHGWGAATLVRKSRAVVGTVEDLALLILCRDPRDIEHAVRAANIILAAWRDRHECDLRHRDDIVGHYGVVAWRATRAYELQPEERPETHGI